MAALLDFLKKKKEAEKAKKTTEAKVAPAFDAKKETAKAAKVAKEPKAPKVSVNEGKFSYTIVKEPHISEKGTILSEKNKYVFKVYSQANKPEIKKAVEGIYGVDVLSVNVISIPHKKRRLGKTEGFRKAYNKAIVTIKEGQKIEVF